MLTGVLHPIRGKDGEVLFARLRPAASSSFLVLIQEKKQKKSKAAAAAGEDSPVRVGMGKWAEKFTCYFLRPIMYPAKFPGLG